MRFVFGRKRRQKLPKVTLQDLKDKFDKDGEFRYVLVIYGTNTPFGAVGDYQSAVQWLEDNYCYGNPICNIVDLMF